MMMKKIYALAALLLCVAGCIDPAAAGILSKLLRRGDGVRGGANDSKVRASRDEFRHLHTPNGHDFRKRRIALFGKPHPTRWRCASMEGRRVGLIDAQLRPCQRGRPSSPRPAAGRSSATVDGRAYQPPTINGPARHAMDTLDNGRVLCRAHSHRARDPDIRLPFRSALFSHPFFLLCQTDVEAPSFGVVTNVSTAVLS